MAAGSAGYPNEFAEIERRDAVRPLGPDSLAWRITGDRRLLLAGGAALVLQVAHPAVGAGVDQHSDFLADPWKRLDDTLQAALRYVFGGQRALDEGRRLRELHKDIQGVDFNGAKYHALTPETYFWVHATLFYAVVRVNRTFDYRLTEPQRARLYSEWRQLGGVLGIPDRVMPADLAEFDAYFADMVAHRLSGNATVRQVLDSLSLREIGPPPLWYVPNVVWAPARPLGRTVLQLGTVGLLPPELRDRLDLRWSERDERRLRAMATALRAAAPLAPAKLRHYQIAYEAKRAAGYRRSAGGRLRRR